MQDPCKTIREEFQILRKAGQARHRDIAQTLRVSEGELIAAHVGVPDRETLLRVVRLQENWPAIIAALESVGEVMALTRNASCVHEKYGIYRNVSHVRQVGLVLGGDIDLRAFYAQWVYGYAVIETRGSGVQQSLQFFDAAGEAIHKVYLQPASDTVAYMALIARFAHADQVPGLAVQMVANEDFETADEEIDVPGFRRAWSELRDTHEFWSLLQRFGVSRTQGLRLADPQFVQPVEPGCVHHFLSMASQERLPIMVFVSNPGMVQIHSGPVNRIAVMGPWLNVLDPRFNLHLREDHIASAWVVCKPTADGLVTSLEIFDQDGKTIAMFFGERKPGKPERCEWRSLIDRLLEESQTCVQ